MGLPESPGLTVHHADARQILASTDDEATFDVIFGDAFHDISIPAHLISDEFNALVKARLRKGGIYALNVVDLLRAPRFVLSLARTLQQRFDAVELWIDLAEISPSERRTTWIVIASDTPTGTGEIRASYGLDRRWVQVPVDAMIAEAGMDATMILTDDFAPVDRLLSGLLLDSAKLEH